MVITPRFEANGIDFSLDGINFKVVVGGDLDREKTDADGVVLLKDWEFVKAELRELEGLDISRMIEFGIWQGGSTVLWPLVTALETYVGIDIKVLDFTFPPSVTTHPRWPAARLHGGVSQDDRQGLTALLDKEFDRPVDLIVDDASHQYLPSKATFEICFPRLRPGGAYVLEDWAWAHAAGDWQRSDHIWAGNCALSNLVFDWTMAAGSRPDIISRVTITSSFAIAFKGDAALGDDFSLDSVTRSRGRKLQPI